MHNFTVFRRTGTHADTLAAVGAASLLQAFEAEVAGYSDRFEIRLRRDVTVEELTRSDPGFRYLDQSSRKQPKLPCASIYELVRAAGVPLDPDQRMYSIIARLGAEGGPNKLMLRFSQLSARQWATLVWEGLNGRADFVTKPSLVQLFNPQAARGYSQLKPAGTDRSDKSKDSWSEPFLEWLRYRGYFQACSGVFLEKDNPCFCRSSWRDLLSLVSIGDGGVSRSPLRRRSTEDRLPHGPWVDPHSGRSDASLPASGEFHQSSVHCPLSQHGPSQCRQARCRQTLEQDPTRLQRSSDPKTKVQLTFGHYTLDDPASDFQ